MAYNNDNAQAFRRDYRAAIHPLYNPWLHAAFVLAYGLLCIGWLGSTLEAVAPWQWLLVPATLVFFSWGEYQVHKRLGHNKTRFGKLFYKRHTGDHHSFFVETLMPYETARDWRVILFPAWLIGAAVACADAYGLWGGNLRLWCLCRAACQNQGACRSSPE